MKKIIFNDNPENTLYVYCRVSTSGQEKDGSSLDVQKNRGIKFSEKLGLNPIVISEQGSGLQPYIPKTNEKGKPEGRHLFTELIDGIEDSLVMNIWVDDDTRLTRNDTDLQFLHLTMKQRGVKLFVGSSMEPKKWDWTTDLVDTIITKVNQQQIRIQVRKSIRSKRKLFSDGCYMKGDPPFGYKLENKRLVPDEDRKEWVQKIYRWYDDGMTTTQIQKILFENSIFPPRYSISNNKWFPLETIVNILSNQNYIGIDVYGDLTNQCPPLVDRRIFDSVQKKISDKKGSKIEVKHDGLLKNILKCPDRKMMTVLGVKKHRKHPLYTCGHRERSYKKRSTNECPIKKSLQVELLDEYIWNLFIDVIKDSKTIREKTKRGLIGNQNTYSIRSINNRIKRLQKELNGLNERRLELDKKFYINELPKKNYQVLSDSITEKETSIESQIKVEELKIKQLRSDEQWIDWLDVHFNRWEEIRNLTELKDKKKVLSEYIHEIIVKDYDDSTKEHHIEIHFRIPIINDKIHLEKNKDGSISRDKKGLRKYKVLKGEGSLNNPLTHQKLLDGGGLILLYGYPYPFQN